VTTDLDAVEVDAFLADSVAVAEGKIYAQGVGWDTIYTQIFPFQQPRIGVGVLLRVPWAATNKMHQFSLKIVDADDHEIALGDAPPGVDTPDGKIRELAGQFNVGKPPMLNLGDSQIVPMAMNLDGLVFHEPNTYNLMISVDGDPVRRLPIRVRATVQIPGAAQPPRLGA
jgi:hypothetical protein